MKYSRNSGFPHEPLRLNPGLPGGTDVKNEKLGIPLLFNVSFYGMI